MTVFPSLNTLPSTKQVLNKHVLNENVKRVAKKDVGFFCFLFFLAEPRGM